MILFTRMLPQQAKTLVTLILVLQGLSSLSIVAGDAEVEDSTCSRYKTCSECLKVVDPSSSCGWCLLENKCSVIGDCPEIPNTSLQWFTKLNGKCPAIESVTPNKAPRTAVKNLNLVLKDVPRLTGRFRCAFTIFNETLITDAVREDNTIKCDTPQSDLLPAIPEEQRNQNEYYYTAKLSVRRTIGPDLVSTNFLFYDCEAITSCRTCLSIRNAETLPCDFCVEKSKCTHDITTECPDALMVNGIDIQKPGNMISTDLCPRINESKSKGAVFVPSGMSKAVTAKVVLKVGIFIVSSRFVCRFVVDNRVIQVNAQLLANTIYCDETTFSYEYKDEPTQIVPFTILWGASRSLDNWGDMHLVLYHCNKLASSCGDCKALDEKYGCGWCESTNTCETRDQCEPRDATWIGNNARMCNSK